MCCRWWLFLLHLLENQDDSCTPGLLRDAERESAIEPVDQNQTATVLPKQLFLCIVFLYLQTGISSSEELIFCFEGPNAPEWLLSLSNYHKCCDTEGRTVHRDHILPCSLWGQLQVQLQPFTWEALPGYACLQTAHATAIWQCKSSKMRIKSSYMKETNVNLKRQGFFSWIYSHGNSPKSHMWDHNFLNSVFKRLM